MHNYKHHIQKDDSTVIREYRTDGRVRVVLSDNSGYVEFIKKNTPEVVAYVAPVVAEPTAEEILESGISTLEMQLIEADEKLPRAVEDLINDLINSGTHTIDDFNSFMIDRKTDKESKRSELQDKIAQRV